MAELEAIVDKMSDSMLQRKLAGFEDVLPTSKMYHAPEKIKIEVAINELWGDYKAQMANVAFGMTFSEYIMARRQAIEELSKENAPLEKEILGVGIEYCQN